MTKMMVQPKKQAETEMDNSLSALKERLTLNRVQRNAANQTSVTISPKNGVRHSNKKLEKK